jgi:adenylosuccinate synthase
MPSGVLSPNAVTVLGNGVVIDPKVLLGEMDGLTERGVDVSGLLISGDAHLIMPHHRALDRVVERYLGSARIGTTGRGIGPSYGDKVARTGIRVQDLLDPGILRKKLELVLREKNQVLVKVYNRKALDVDAVTEEYLTYAQRLRPHIADTREVLWEALERGATVLLEGAQATMLDLDHGTYPFVTSSNPTAAGACVGTGIPPTQVSQVIGVAKAYTTRVGSGPFPTEQFEEAGAHLRKVGDEYGTTTGRERRCGWFDAVVGRYAVRVNGITDLVVTKLDVLSGLSTVPICVAYEVDGKRTDTMPTTQTGFHHATPIYEELPGWWEDVSKARAEADLPDNARRYLERIEQLCGVRVSVVGVGPRRDETIIRHDLLPA